VLRLPLNFDYFTDFVILNLNTPLFHNFMSVLDGFGKGAAQLNSGGPLPPGTTGIVMYFAYTLPFFYVSNPIEIVVVP
jgi:hypothetical protein